jgi:hypothetical protein
VDGEDFTFLFTKTIRYVTESDFAGIAVHVLFPFQQHKVKIKQQGFICVLVWISYRFVPVRIFVLLALIHITFPFNIYYVHSTYCLAASTYRSPQKPCPCF